MNAVRSVCLGIMICSALCSAHAKDGQPEKQTDPVIAEVLGRAIRMSEKDKMNGMIVDSLVESYAKERKIEPTKAEIEAFVSKSREKEKQKRKEWEKKRKDILEKLKTRKFPESERKQLRSELELLDSLLKVAPQMAKYEQENPQKVTKIEEDIARHFVWAWKLNKALFEQYGGRVIFQQAGVEPVDAYRDFLKEEERKGSFKIFDKKFEPTFWEYYTKDNMHTFISETREQGAKIFETPWWLMDEQKESELMDLLMTEPSK